MHYIRFLKSPRLLSTPSPVLSAKITVTTDLGESFLCADVALVVELEPRLNSKISNSGKRTEKEYIWKGSDGMRSLEISIPIPQPKNGERVVMLVRPKEAKHNVESFEVLLKGNNTLDEDEGQIVAVRSMDVNVSQSGGQKLAVGMVKRLFSLGKNEVPIWEENGESIARHIWDAGLILSSYLATISSVNAPPKPTRSLPELPLLRHALSIKGINVLELGAGCGIVGITLSRFYPNASKILLTDLPEATEILTRNLNLCPPLGRNQQITHEILDWSSPLPPNVKNTDWDMVIVSDCTYNPGVVPDLVLTLRSIATKSQRDVVILLAMKVRHESEIMCFDLMAQSGFAVREKAVLPLPMLAGESEQIEIFVLTLRA